MFAFRIQDKILPFNGYMVSGGKSSSNSSSNETSSSTVTPAQRAEFEKLLGGATQWFGQGGLDSSTEYTDKMKKIYEDMTGSLMETITGKSDTAGLQNILNMQREAGIDNINAASLGATQSAASSGGLGGSRHLNRDAQIRSEGAKDMSNAQNQTIFNWQNAQDAKRSEALGQLGQVGQGYAGLNQLDKSGSQNALDSLLAYKNLISGDMGGTSSGTGTSTGYSNSSNTSFNPISLMTSDETLKKNVKKTGKKIRVNKTGAEVPEKEFEYTKEAKEEYGAPSGKFKGAMAQDVEKEDPSAVSEIKSKKGKGKKKALDYNKLDKAFKAI